VSDHKGSSVVNNYFDPLADLFVAQAAKPPQVREINLRALPPFHRALLVIDGTVTKFIEAYTMDPVEVIRINQEERVLPIDNDWLEASEGTKVIAREVLLWGKYSYRFYAYATSLIVPERVPEKFKQGLEIDPGGIGRILLSNRLETYREVLWYGKERPGQLPAEIQHFENDEFISRTYRIIAAHQPLMLINEKFPMRIDLPNIS